MVRSFETAPLTIDQIDSAYPLVQASMPEVDITLWRQYARPLVEAANVSGGPPFGIIGLRNAANYLCGLFVYRVTRTLHEGPILVIDLFAAVDLVNVEAATRALLDATEDKARRMGCGCVDLQVSARQEALIYSIMNAGHVPQGRVFRKQIGALDRTV